MHPICIATRGDRLIAIGTLLNCHEKVTGFRFDCDDLLMNLKLAQCTVFYGCCANVGMCLRIFKKEEWANMKGRKEVSPHITGCITRSKAGYISIHIQLGSYALMYIFIVARPMGDAHSQVSVDHWRIALA